VKSYYASIDHLMLPGQLAISIPGTEAAVIRHFQKRIPYVLFVPEADAGATGPASLRANSEGDVR
jgi:hypothetical protein